jgi:hypothetical protein
MVVQLKNCWLCRQLKAPPDILKFLLLRESCYDVLALISHRKLLSPTIYVKIELRGGEKTRGVPNSKGKILLLLKEQKLGPIPVGSNMGEISKVEQFRDEGRAKDLTQRFMSYVIFDGDKANEREYLPHKKKLSSNLPTGSESRFLKTQNVSSIAHCSQF